MKDFWGLPVARLSGGTCIRRRWRSATVQAKSAEAWLKEAGAIRTWKKMAGTTRVPAEDSTRRARAAWATIRTGRWWTRYCQVHDVDNVYVIDCERARDEWRIQPGADHYGDCVLCVGRAWCGAGRGRGSGMKRVAQFAARAGWSALVFCWCLGLYGASLYYESRHGAGVRELPRDVGTSDELHGSAIGTWGAASATKYQR